MKKQLKIIIAIFIIFILLLILNIFRNYYILSRISKSNEDLKNSLNNYYLETISESNNSNKKNKLFVKNNVYNLSTLNNNTLYSTNWFNSNTNETISINEQDKIISLNTLSEKELNILFYEPINNLLLPKEEILNILLNNIFTPIIENDGIYKLNYNDSTFHINKATNLIEKVINENYITTYLFEQNSVTDENVKKTDISILSEYQIIE